MEGGRLRQAGTQLWGTAPEPGFNLTSGSEGENVLFIPSDM